MSRRKAVRNMILGVALVGVAVLMGAAAVASIRLVMSLPR